MESLVDNPLIITASAPTTQKSDKATALPNQTTEFMSREYESDGDEVIYCIGHA